MLQCVVMFTSCPHSARDNDVLSEHTTLLETVIKWYYDSLADRRMVRGKDTNETTNYQL